MPRSIHLPAVVLLAFVVVTTLATCTVRSALGAGPAPRAAGGPPGWGRGMMGPGMGPRGRGMMMGRGMGPRGRGMMGGSMQRHRWAMMGGIPTEYGGLRNPLPHNAETVAKGRGVFQIHCATCHGEQGLGNGPAAASLSPSPPNLPWVLARPMATDAYLMWTISEGGAALGTAMPAFKDSLSATERWQLVHYLREL